MKRDIILLIVILCIGALGILFTRAFFSGNGAEVIITVDGEEYGRYSLYSPETIVVSDSYGTNTVIINNGQAFVTEADCPDGICEKHTPISCNHETIVCLPHKLVVEVTGGKEADIDTMTN